MLTRAQRAIPGLTQLLSKRPDQFGAAFWPSYFRKAKGSHVWDLDGRKYLDMSISGIGANVLGYCDYHVDKEVQKVVRLGNSTSLNCPEDVELAELLIELHPWAAGVRYARTGGEAMAVAIRLARAASGKSLVLFCGYHGWHDWYLAANLGSSDALGNHLLPGLEPGGVPEALMGSAIPFSYNDLEGLRFLVRKHSDEIAAIVMEPVRSTPPDEGFLESVRKLATEVGAVLIFDEISTGFRYEVGGFHLRAGVTPDIAVFAKAMSNGFAMAAVLGKSDVMDSFKRTFVSSTYWTERIGPAAALATIKKLRKGLVAKRLHDLGTSVQEIWEGAGKEFGLPIRVTGLPAMSYLSFEGVDGLEKQTLYTKKMLEAGILAGGRFYANFAQSDEHINRFRAAVYSANENVSLASSKGDLEFLVKSSPVNPGFGRLN